MQAVEKLTAVAVETSRIPKMKAIVHRAYGEPEVLAVGELAMPEIGEDDVLVRVVAAGVSIGDHHVVTGKPYLIRLSPFGGIPRPKHPVPGGAFAGRVHAVGAKVSAFRVGDEVFGQAPNGAFAEYLAMPADRIARKPSNLTFEEAAAVPWGTTALQGLRDAGGLKAGDRVLVNGASGAVGTWAVQLAKAFGAHVTAVCSARNAELMRSLGADEVLDYTTTDFVEGGARFDVLMDLVGNRALSDCKAVLLPGGRYVPCAGGSGDWLGPLARILGGLLVFLLGGRSFKMFIQNLNAADLVVLRELVEAKRVRPVVERTWPLAEVGSALRHVGAGHSRGVNVLRIA